MPRIPEKRSGFRQQGYSDPTIRTDGAGIVNSAIQRAAGQVTDFTVQLMQKRKKAQDSNYAFNKYMEDFEATSRFEEELKLDEGANPETYAQRMREFTQERMESGLESAPSDEARDLYNRKALPLFTKSELDAENYQNIQKAEYYFKSKQDNISAASNALLDNPNYIKAKEIQDQLDEDYQNDVDLYGEKVARQALKDNKNKLAFGVLDGLEAQGRYGEALNLITNNEAEGKITNEIEPEQKAQLIKRYQRKIKDKNTIHASDLRNQVSDRYAAALKGDLDPAGLDALEAQIDLSDMRPEAKMRLKDNISIARAISPTIRNMKDLPASEWLSPDEIIGSLPKNFNEGQRARARASLQQTMIRDNKIRNSDGAGYVLSNSPEIQNQQQSLDGEQFVEALLNEQRLLGIKNTRPLPRERVKASVRAIENGNASEVVEAFDTIKQQFGKHSGAVIAQMVSDGKMNSDYILAASLNNPMSQTQIIENIRNEREYDDIISQSQEKKAQKANLKYEFDNNEAYVEMQSAMLRGSNSGRHPFVAAIASQTEVEAKRLISNGMSASEAATAAFDLVYTDNFFTADSGTASTIVPRKINDGKNGFVEVDKDLIDTFMQTHTTKEYLQASGLQVPVEYSNLFTGDMTEAEISEQYYENMSKEVFWDLSSDQRTLVLKQRNDSNIQALTDDFGEPIKKDIVGIMNDPDEFQSKGVNNIWSRWFETGNKANANE